MRALLLVVTLTVCISRGGAQIVESNDHVIQVRSGEAQSTVVPPGKIASCPPGRFLVVDDTKIGLNTGLVTGRDLDKLDGPDILATFNRPPNPQYYAYGTNDCDLVTLNDGTVLYITGAFSIAPPPNKPAWWSQTFRGTFGPGAHYVVMVWRSLDAGATFRYFSQYDPARDGNGLFAFPQFLRDKDGNRLFPNGRSRLDMGGSDGQLVKVDPATNTIYLTFGVVGNHGTKLPNGAFQLSETPIDLTAIVVSKNGGLTWKTMGTLKTRDWRMAVVPIGLDSVIFGYGLSNWVTSASWSENRDRIDFSQWYWQTDPGEWGYRWAGNSVIDFINTDGDPITGFIRTYMYAHTIAGRTPGAFGHYITYPTSTTIAQSSGSLSLAHGYRMFFSSETAGYQMAKPILPVPADANRYIMHVTQADPGSGPILLYWYDVDAKKARASIRGRLILGQGQVSSDFGVSRARGIPRSFTLTTGKRYWYGDYHTASGYVEKAKVGGRDYDVHYYFPMWVEPSGTVRFTKVVMALPSDDTRIKFDRAARDRKLTRQPDALIPPKLRVGPSDSRRPKSGFKIDFDQTKTNRPNVNRPE